MTSVRTGINELRAAGGFLGGLRPFLRKRVSSQEAHQRLERQLARREQVFRRVLQRSVFEHNASPYRRLFKWSRVSPATVDKLLDAHGLEGTLERLHDAGVYLTLEEFKGRLPVQRAGLEFEVCAEDFDNPLSARQFEARTGGSGGNARRILVGLDLLEHESAYHAGYYAMTHGDQRPVGMWLPAPPGAVGIKNALIRAKLGQPIARWFSQNRLGDAPMKHGAFARATVLAASAFGSRIPMPEYVPAGDAGHVASWLAAERATGIPAMLLTTPSAAVRTCAAAIERGLEIAGSAFVLVGEPYTPAKASVVAAAGCSASSHYAMVEAGMIGLACLAASAPDDVHVVSDKVATIQRMRTVGASTVPALLHTTLLPASPKVMLNVESGDYAVRETRECGCGALPAGFQDHLHTIRSYEKLTSEGMHFLGGDLHDLLERVLPAIFGGNATDYQFVEREQRGLPKVSLVVSPHLGALHDDEVIATVLGFLRGRGIGQRLMADIWTSSETLQIERRVPHVTQAGKIQSLQKLGE